MKPAPFEYHSPETLEDAARLLAELDDAKILAGGQSLVPMLSLRLAFFDHLVDISRLAELKNVEQRGQTLHVGAGVTEATAENDPEIGRAVPLLAKAAPHIGHFQIRNRGTIGGSIAHADPAGELPLVALTLDAELHVRSQEDTRTIPAQEFFTGLWDTSMEPEEILVGVGFPIWPGRTGFAVEEFARRHGDFAMAGAAIGITLDDDDTVTRCAVGLLGLGSTPLRASDAERSVVGRKWSDVTPEELGRLAMEGLDEVPEDLHGSARYRTRVGATMVARAWKAAGAEATNG